MNVRRMILLLWAAVALLSLMGAWNVAQIQSSRAAARARQTAFNHAASDSLRTVLCFAESAVLTSKRVTPEQRRQAVQFYESALRKIHASPCK